MSESASIHVNNIAPTTDEKSLREFFSFCGKISSLSLTPGSSPDSPKSATITFSRASAAKTAALLDGTPLDKSPLSVAPAHSLDEIAGSHVASTDTEDQGIAQEDKPRSTIFAEYLAHGYVVGDNVLAKGIELDQKHGISSRFLSTLNSALTTVDQKTHATERAKAADDAYGISAKAGGVWGGFSRYFEKALDTAPGQRIRAFYQEGGKRVVDIHNEAKRLAEMKLGKPVIGTTHAPRPAEGEEGKTVCGCASKESECGCAPGSCACDSCPKKDAAGGKNEPVFVGPEKTTCACGGQDQACGCEAGKCACAGCDKKESAPAKEAEGKAGLTGQAGHAAEDVGNVARDLAGQ